MSRAHHHAAGLGWAAFYLALAAVCLLGGCLRTSLPAGATTCLQNSVMISDGRYLEEQTDCSGTVPPTVCAEVPDGGAFCHMVPADGGAP